MSFNDRFLGRRQQSNTVKSVYNFYPWDPKIVAIVDMWSLFKGHFCSKSQILDLKIITIIDRWSLFGYGYLLRFDYTFENIVADQSYIDKLMLTEFRSRKSTFCSTGKLQSSWSFNLTILTGIEPK